VARVKLPFVPGPSDVINAVEGVRDGFSEALALVPRVATAVGTMEGLLGRVTALLDRVDGVVDRADEAIRSVAGTQAQADAAIAGVTRTQAKADAAIAAVTRTQALADEAIAAVTRTQVLADEAIEAAGRTIVGAGGTLEKADSLVGRLDPLLAAYEGPLAGLAPSVRRLSETLEPHEIEALVTLIDRLPRLVQHLDQDVLPVLESLGNVGTDVHDLVDTVQDLRQIVKGFPGSRLFRRRGAEEIAQEEAEEARDNVAPR
jgi:hypothetical protein